MHHAMKLYWRSGCIASPILISALDGDEWSASSPGCDGEEKKFHHCPYWELNPRRTTLSLITKLTELPRLSKGI
jgi:hypothetical protein